MTIQIVGFSDSVKIPGFFGETVYNAGSVSAGSIPLKLLVCGTQLGSGTATPNSSVEPIFSSVDADTYFGAGSEIAVMCYGALQIPGVSLWAASVPEAGGAAASTAVIVIGGTWTAGGTLNFRIDGVKFSVTALSTDTPTTFGTTIAAAVTGVPHCSASAVNSTGTITLTRKSKGVRGNFGSLYVDTSAIPSGMTVGIAGGTNTTVSADSNARVLPQASIVIATPTNLPAGGGTVYDAALNTSIAYTSAQSGPQTTVAAGSNGVNVNTFAGAGVLHVASTTGYPAGGGTVFIGNGTASGVSITYTGVSGGNTFTGCTTLAGGAGALSTGDNVDGNLLLGCTGGTGTLATGQILYDVVAMTGTGCRFTGGSGVDSVTTLQTSVIQATQFDRIAFAQNDASNAALWHTFLNNQAAPLTGILQHGVCALNDIFSNATSLAQTTLNAERVQCLWQNDGESIPSFIAATFASVRTAVEQGDPDAAYDGYELPGVAPQSQKTDWPSTSTLIAALNDGVTPISTDLNNAAYIVRSITTHSQDASGNPQYTTLDTSEAVVPDFVRLTEKLLFLTQIKPANPRNGPDPAASAKRPPAGFLTPSLWAQFATNAHLALEQAAPPILLPGSTAANPIYAEWDSIADRVMAVSPVVPCPNTHQIGVSVRNVTSV